MFKISSNSLKSLNQKFNRVSLKLFRDYRDHTMFYQDGRWKSGFKPSVYTPQFSLTEAEKEENNKLPVEKRILDWDKYMRHKGKLKYTSGKFATDVEPFPRLKIMMLCDIIMNLLSKLKDTFPYKQLSYETTKYIMKVVDENESIIDIEEKISQISSVEDLIAKLHNEVTLLQHFVQYNTYEQLLEEFKDFDAKEFFFSMAAFRDNHPFPQASETYKHNKNEKPGRPDTAFTREDNDNGSEETKNKV